jgi:hypothetical protein
VSGGWFETIAERKRNRRQLTEDGNVEISERKQRRLETLYHPRLSHPAEGSVSPDKMSLGKL